MPLLERGMDKFSPADRLFIIAVTPTKFKRIVTNHNSDANPAGAITAPIWPPGGEEAVADTKRIRAETLADKRSLAAGSAPPLPWPARCRHKKSALPSQSGGRGRERWGGRIRQSGQNFPGHRGRSPGPAPHFACSMAILRFSIHNATRGLNSARPLSTGTLLMPALASWLFHESGSSPAMSLRA